MSAPDPSSLAIAQLLADACAVIRVDNGYRTDITGTGIEPLAFDETESFPRIVALEESADISESNARKALVKAVYAVAGYAKSDAANAIANAHRLRTDILVALGRFGAARIGAPITKFEVTGQIDVGKSDAPGFVQAVVRANVEYSESFPPMQGT